MYLEIIFNRKLLPLACFLLTGCASGGDGGGVLPPDCKNLKAPRVSVKNTNPIEKYQWHLDGDNSQTDFGMYLSEMIPSANLNLQNTWRPVQNTLGDDGCRLGNGILVSVIDSGLEINHPDLRDNIHPARGKNFTNGSNDPSPTGNGGDHGTSVAGLIGMVDNNIGGLGVAPKVKMLGFNIVDGKPHYSQDYAYSFGNDPTSPAKDADIINQSYGHNNSHIETISETWDNLTESRISSGRSGKGVIFVKAAGNDHDNHDDNTKSNEERKKLAEICKRANKIGTSCGFAGAERGESLPIIVTTSVNSLNKKSSYSSAGAIWVSGFGGEYGLSNNRKGLLRGKSYPYNKTLQGKPAMVTTDVTTCDKGYSKSDNGFIYWPQAQEEPNVYKNFSYNDFDYDYQEVNYKSESGNVYLNITAAGEETDNLYLTTVFSGDNKAHPSNQNCDYTSTFNGTSAAAPIVSGVVALLLSQYPNLTIWDVRYILAKTATKIDANYKVTKNIPGIGDYNFSKGWITNAAGLNYSDWYGFGLVNVDKALLMAKTYSKLITTVKTTSIEKTFNVEIRNKNKTGVSKVINVAQTGKVDHINLYVDLESSLQDIEITLTSPSGTNYHVFTAGTGFSVDNLNFTQRLVTNAFLGENIKGDWTITIKDLFNNGDFGVYNDYAGNTDGVFKKWKMDITYHED